MTFVFILACGLFLYDQQFRITFLNDCVVKPGLYCKPTKFSEKLVQTSSLFKYPFYHDATPYLFNGEWQTMIPFMLYTFQPVQYERVWIPTRDAFGIFFFL